MAVVSCMHVEEAQWAGRGPCDMHSVHVPAGRPVGDVAVIADALGEGRPQMAARPCSGRVSGLRAGVQRGVSADGQRKQSHPLKDREEGILRQSRYRKALGLLIVSVHCVAARLYCAIGCSCVAIDHSCVAIDHSCVAIDHSCVAIDRSCVAMIVCVLQ